MMSRSSVLPTPDPRSPRRPAVADSFRWRQERVRGWEIRIRDPWPDSETPGPETALPLLDGQIRKVEELLPRRASRTLRKTVLWLSPAYPGVRPTAEYHPGAQWLRDNGRDPAMVKGVEFTDVPLLAQEVVRMPVLLLHELAHAWHDQILGFDHPDVVAAWERNKQSGRLDKVERRLFGRSDRPVERHYGLTNPQEFFAEMSEAWFDVNDFFPTNRRELVRTDPETARLVERLWNADPAKPRNASR